MHNLDKPELVSSNLRNECFHTYASKEAIVNHFKKIISGQFQPQYPKHVNVTYCQADKMLGLVALHADVVVHEQYGSGMYFCRFSKNLPLATSSSRHFINQNFTVGAIMLPLTNSNGELQIQNSVIYSDWEFLNPMVTRDYLRHCMICFKSNVLLYY